MSVPVIYFDLGDTLVFGPSGNKQPFDDAVATIDELWRRGYRIGLLSNQSPDMTLADMPQKLTDYGLEADRFDVITISSEFDPPIYKPDPAIFAAALAKAGHAVASADTVFITETLPHIDRARSLGWRAIHRPYPGGCTAASGECIEDLDELLGLFPPLPVDLYIRDAPGDPGDDAFGGPVFWNSPDMWIRHSEDGGTAHEPPEAGRDNHFYTRVRNRGVGIARNFLVGWAVQEWAGTQFVYPDDYWPFLAFAPGENLAPGDSQVVHGTWPAAEVPAVGTHACWLAAARTPGDLPASAAHVWEHNNLAQKNLTIVEAAAGEEVEMSAVIGSRWIREARFYRLEIHRSERFPDLAVSLVGESRRSIEKLARAGRAFFRQPAAAVEPPEEVAFRFLDGARVELTGIEGQEGGRVTLDLERGSTLALAEKRREAEVACYEMPTVAAAALVRRKLGGAAVAFAPGPASGIGIALRPGQIVRTRLRLQVPADAEPGERIRLSLVQRGRDGRIDGGVDVEIRVRKPRKRRVVKRRKATKARKTAKTKKTIRKPRAKTRSRRGA